MRPDTPLPDVARMLPTDAAALLKDEPPQVQELICKRVRDALVFLEALDVILDPVTYEAVVTLLVAQDLPMAHTMKNLLTQNAQLLKERHGST